MDLDAGNWSQLPGDMEEKVLSFLPVPDVCRCRRVCRTWNALMHGPAFATANAENGERQGASSFIATELVGNKYETCLWCILDLNERRWYTIHDDRYSLSRRGGAAKLSSVLAMDGGLVCRSLETERGMFSLHIYDLMGHTERTLPPIRRHVASTSLPLVHIVVDGSSRNFVIFVLQHNLGAEFDFPVDAKTLKLWQSDPVLSVFHSPTSEWRSASNPPWIADLGFGFAENLVMFQAQLYTWLGDGDLLAAVVCYNPAADAWLRTDLCFDTLQLRHLQLVATSTRLFLSALRYPQLSPAKGRDTYVLGVGDGNPSHDCRAVVHTTNA